MAPHPSSSVPPSRDPRVRELSTAPIAPRERFDFWRSQFSAFVEMEPNRDEGEPTFDAQMTHYVAGRGVQFTAFRAGATVNRFCANASDGSFVMTQILSGRVELRDRAGSSFVSGSGLVLLDHSRPVTTRNSNYTFCHLRLPHALVIDALGADPLSAASASLLRLEGDPLAPFLSAQLRLLFERAPTLAETERTAVVDASVDLALALLRARLRSLPSDREVLEQGLFQAASAFIKRHAHRPELTPEWVASAVNCSRARLYRVFAARETGVFELIRETRLRMSRERLAENPSEPVSTIAFDCGFRDPPTFNRAFKHRFGLSPTQWREQNAHGPS